MEKKKKKDELTKLVTYDKNGDVIKQDFKGSTTPYNKPNKQQKVSGLEKAGFVTRNIEGGLFSGFSQLPNAGLQEAQKELKKGENIKSAKDYINMGVEAIVDAAKGPLIPGSNIVNGMGNYLKNVKKVWSDKDSNIIDKIGGTVNEAVNAGAGILDIPGEKAAKRALNLYGSKNKNLDEKVQKVREKVMEPSQKFQQQIAEDKQTKDYGKITNSLASAGNVVGFMGPSIAASWATKNPELAKWIMANNVKGQATDEALNAIGEKEREKAFNEALTKGYSQKDAIKIANDKANKAMNSIDSLEKATKIGNTKGFLEQAIEGISGVKFLGKGATDDIVRNVLNENIKNPILNYGAKIGTGVLGENVEETISDIANHIINKGTISPEDEYTLKDLRDTWGTTTISTLMMNALGGGYSARAYRQNLADLNLDTSIEKANLVKSLPDAEKSALTEITIKRKRGEQLTDQDLATIQYINFKNTIANQDLNVANNRVQQIQQAVQNGQMTAEQGIQAIQNINDSLTSQNQVQNQPIQAEPTQPSTNSQGTKNVSQQPINTQNEYQEPMARQMTPEEVEEMDRAKTESLNRMAETEGYNNQTPGQQLVQENDVSDRKVKAIQYEHPEIKKYYKEAAEVLGAEADMAAESSFQSGTREIQNELGQTEYRRFAGSNGFISKDLQDFASENNLTAKQVQKAANDIIDDNGKENNANAKKLEKVLDERLRNGYSAFGDKFEPNQDYINEMESIAFDKQRQNDLEALGDKKVDMNIEEKRTSDSSFSNENTLPHSSSINEVGYHASNANFEKYDTNKIGTGQGDNTQGKGINLASIKDAVDGIYGKNIYKTKIKLKNAYTVDDKKLLSTFEKDFGYKTDMENISDELKKKGYDGIIINVNGNKLYTVFDADNLEIVNNKQENVNAVKETNDEYLRIDDNGNSKMSNEMPKILDEVQKEDRKIDIDTVVDTGMRLLVNKGHNIDKVAKANGINRLKTSYDRTLAVGQEGQNQIKRAQTDLRGKEYNNFKVKDKDGKITNKNLSYMGIFEDAEKSKVPTKVLEEYAVNKLNLDRRASGNEKWVEQFPNMTEEYSKKVIDDIEKLYSEIKRCHGNLTQYFANIREKMVDSGIMSKDSKEYYDMNTPNYVPIQKAVGRRGSSVSSSQNAKGVKTYNQKKIKGGNFDIQPLRETGAQFTLDTLATMRKNIVGQQLGKIIAPEYDLEAAELGENYDQETAKKLGKGEYTLTYFENGEAKTIPIDSGIYHAMTNPQISEGLKLAGELNQKYGAGLLSRAQRGLLTDKNVYFIFTNLFKDIGDAPLNSKHTARFLKNYPSMIVDLGGKGPYSTLWKNLGGVASSYFKDGEFVGERQYKSKVGKAIDKVGKGIDWALTPIEVGNNFVEQLPRLTEFKSTIEANGYEVTADGDVVPIEGKNPTKSVDEVLDEAMYNAAEITTNFKRGGTLTKIANRNGATFLNASVQGFDKFIRNFTDVVDTTGAKPKINSKAAVKLMLKATIFGVTTSMLNDAMNDDDDDYKDIPEYQKDNYYLFKLGNHKWLRIPKGRMASIFGDAARRTKNAMKGDDKAFEGFLQQIQNQIAPNSVFTDNVLSGFRAVKNNKSWSGNQIVSDWEKNDAHPEDEYDAKTDEFSKWLGKKLGKSPKKINYLLDQYTGVVGDIALPLMTKYTNTPIDNKLGQVFVAPLANKFTTNDIMSNKSQSKFYDEYNKTKDQVSHNQKIGKPNDKTTIKSKYLGDQNKKLAELKTQITEIQESNMSNKEKIKKVEKLQKQINDISKKSLETSKKVKVDDYLATAGKNIYVKDDKGKWRAETDKTKEKRDELGLDVEDYYYYKKDEAFEKPDGKTVSIVDGEQAKDKIALVEAFDFDPSDYLEYEYEIGKIRGDKNAKGKTISGSAKKKVISYINSLPISVEQKAALYKKKGYKSQKYDGVVFDYINNSDLSREEKESLASFLKIK